MSNVISLERLDTPEAYFETGTELQNALSVDQGRALFNKFKNEDTEVWVMRIAHKIMLAMSVRVREDGKYVNHVVGLANRRPTMSELENLEKLLDTVGVSLEYDPHTIM